MGRKGLELPINMIIILAVAVLVLVLLSAFFLGGASKSTSSISDTTAWGNGCAAAIASGCSAGLFSAPDKGLGMYISGYDPNGDDKKGANGATVCNQATLTSSDSGCADDSLYTACVRSQGTSDAASCRAKCCK